MKLEWLGQYRELVEKIICFANGYSQVNNNEFMGNDIKYSFSQIQVVEYLLENEDLNQKMSEVALNLGLTASSFTKLVNKLVVKGFLKKYHIHGNRKDVILQVTDIGRRVYKEYSEEIAAMLFGEMFEIGNSVPIEFIQTFTKMMESLNSKMNFKGKQPVILLPIEEDKGNI